MKALLIIDMQVGSFTEATPRYDTEEVVEKINALSELYRKNGDKVIFVQHDGSSENCFVPGTLDWEILPELVTKDGDLFVGKTANDSFYKTDLDAILKSSGINEITVTGCATDFCVEATIQSALVKDYNITVIKDGHTTAADRPHASGKTIIDHYNWIWENLSPTNGKIEVLPFDEAILEKV